MTNTIIPVPQMLLIGSTGRNSGKTTIAAAGIDKWKDSFPVIALKVTCVEKRGGECPRGGHGCGACSSLQGNFDLLEETDAHTKKDTSILLAAGAQKVYWLKTLKSHIGEGIRHFLTLVPEDALVICESNSLRNVVDPGVFIMLNNSGDAPVKKSAGNVMHKADILIDYDINGRVEGILDSIKISGDRTLKVQAG